jgi:hypothetical protein
MQMTVKPNDYTEWAYDELNKPLDCYAYRDRSGNWEEVYKCWITPLEYNYLLTDSSDLILDRTLAGHLRSCIIPRKILKALHYTKGDIVLQDEEVTSWVNFVARTDNAYHKYSTAKQDVCINET